MNQVKETKEPTLAEKAKALRQQVKEVMNVQFGELDTLIRAEIPTDEGMNFTTYRGKLQHYLLAEVQQGFFDVMTGLHKLWETFPDKPEEELTQASVKLALKARGVSFKRLADVGEYLVGGSYHTDSLRDALLTGMKMKGGE